MAIIINTLLLICYFQILSLCTVHTNANYTTSTQTLSPLPTPSPEVGEEGLCMSVY